MFAKARGAMELLRRLFYSRPRTPTAEIGLRRPKRRFFGPFNISAGLKLRLRRTRFEVRIEHDSAKLPRKPKRSLKHGFHVTDSN